MAHPIGIGIGASAAADYHGRDWWREQTLLDDFPRHAATGET
jgi:hypothetical protein